MKSKTNLKILLSCLPLALANGAYATDNVKIDTNPDSSGIVGFHQQMERRFQNMVNNFFNDPMPVAGFSISNLNANSYGAGYPRADVKESEKDVEIKIDLPGIDKKNLDIAVFEDNVTIKVAQESKKEEKNNNYFISERQSGMIQRVIPLPSLVNYGKAENEYKDGVLTIKIPKIEDQKPKYKKLEI